MKLPGVLSKLATPLDRLQVRTRQTLNIASTGSVHLKQPRDRKITRIISRFTKEFSLIVFGFFIWKTATYHDEFEVLYFENVNTLSSSVV